jgi:ribosomal protein S27E
MSTKKPLWIDCVAGSQLRDTQGEMLSIEGCDISKLENGGAIWTDNHGKGFFNNIGRITYGKKIFKAEDCEDERQRYYWEKIRAPYIYAKGYLYDDEDHPNARAAAAVVRNIHKSDCPLKMKSSVEGGVVSRGISDSTLLARTKLTGVALTLTPANQATLLEPLNLDKSSYDNAADMNLIKSVLHLAQTDTPSFRHIARDASATKVVENIEKIAALVRQEGSEICVPSKHGILQYALESKIQGNVVKIKELVFKAKQEELGKALTAGYGGAGPPTSLTHGGVLQSEALDDGRRNKASSFKYITCPSCGHEQIYSKYQVKCRGENCGKSFPMETLHKLFLGAIAT